MYYECVMYTTDKMNDNQTPANDIGVEMNRCAAYEVTTLYRQKVSMKENPSYELHVIRAD